MNSGESVSFTLNHPETVVIRYVRTDQLVNDQFLKLEESAITREYKSSVKQCFFENCPQRSIDTIPYQCPRKTLSKWGHKVTQSRNITKINNYTKQGDWSIGIPLQNTRIILCSNAWLQLEVAFLIQWLRWYRWCGLVQEVISS